uniref:Uncharacterized protein n=1 Tax=Meloidogyne enterolobii TaxID=390850 RepID=A0A6V7UF97_MELEN|nr:unnamed protein product [Meloidogyne enterolobii]
MVDRVDKNEKRTDNKNISSNIDSRLLLIEQQIKTLPTNDTIKQLTTALNDLRLSFSQKLDNLEEKLLLATNNNIIDAATQERKRSLVFIGLEELTLSAASARAAEDVATAVGVLDMLDIEEFKNNANVMHYAKEHANTHFIKLNKRVDALNNKIKTEKQ